MAKFKTPIRVSVDTSQLDGLVRRLADVDKKAARTAMKKGINEITKLVLKEAKKLVPARTGALRRSLGRFVQVKGQGRAVLGVVKPRAGVWMTAAPGLVGRQKSLRGKTRVFVQKFRMTHQGKPVNPVYYAHLVEYGRAEVTVKNKKVLSTGKKDDGGVILGPRVRMVPPRPFMRPAWEKYEFQAPQILAGFLGEELRKFWEKSRSK